MSASPLSPLTAEPPHPEVLQIRKYPNRRYYDTTTSRHLSLQEIHQLIVRGHDVRIVDAPSGQDITAKILTQILLDYEPVKLEVFSHELLLQTIRVNDALLKDFVDLYFRQAFEAFCASQQRFRRMLRETQQLTSRLVQPATWMSGFFSSGNDAAPTGKSEGQRKTQSQETNVSEAAGENSLQEEVAKLREELRELKAQINPPRTTRRK